MKEYKPGIRLNKGFRLNTNENSYTLSININFLIKIINKNKKILKIYPDNNNNFILNILSKKYKISVNNIFLCNGSDEGLFLLFNLIKKKFLKIPTISYPFYEVYSTFNKILKKKIIYKYIYNFNNIILPIPNSPTGEFYNIKFIKKNIKKKNILIIDEAYSDFNGFSFLKYINEKNNLIIIKTMSKFFSSANIRIGFIFSNKKIIKKLNKIKYFFNSYTLNSISSYIAIECLKSDFYHNYISQKINFNKFFLKIILKKKSINLFGNFLFLNFNIDFFIFFKKNNFFFRLFFLKKHFVRVSIPNFLELKKFFIFYNKWS